MSSPKFARLLLALPLAAAALVNSVQASAIAWRTNLDAAKIESMQSGKLLLLHFYTDTCGPCKVLEKQVFNQPHVGAAIEKSFVPVKVNASHSPALAGMYRVERWPTDLILSPQGSLIAQFGCPNKPEAYLAQLNNLATHYQQTTAGSRTVDTPQRTNAAYAGLETQLPPSANAVSNRMALADAAAGSTRSATEEAAPTQLQVTANPYVTMNNAAATPGGAAAPPTGRTPSATSGLGTNVAQQAAPGGPAMPANAMPQSYRYQVVAAPPTSGPAAGAPETSGPVAATPNAYAQSRPPQPPITPTPITPTPTRPTNNVAVQPTSQTAAGVQAPNLAAAQVPAGSPPLGFDGCCPVTLKFANRWVQGRVDVGMEHRGRLYLFAGEKERQQFAANPDAYSPVFAGLDPVLMLDENQAVAGHRRFGFRYQGQFYLFSSAETKQRFADDPTTYALGVRQAMHRIDASDTGIIRR